MYFRRAPVAFMLFLVIFLFSIALSNTEARTTGKLVPRHAIYIFAPSVQQLQLENPAVYQLYSSGKNPLQLAQEYDYLRQHDPAKLAGLLNIAVALQTLKPVAFLPFYKQLVSIQQDRFFAFADAKIVDQLEQEAAAGTLKRQNKLDLLLHRGSTSSYKEIDLPEANVQITLHKKVTATIDGVDCILVETDIDYFKNLWKHTFLEVLPNLALRHKTNPKKVYGFRERSEEFNPTYLLLSSSKR